MIFPTAHQLTSKGTQGLDINFKYSDNPVHHSLRGYSSVVTPLYSVSYWDSDVGSQVTRQSVTDPTLNHKGPNQLPNEPVQGCTRISWCPRGRNSSKRVNLQIKGDSEETSGIQNLLGIIIGESASAMINLLIVNFIEKLKCW